MDVLLVAGLWLDASAWDPVLPEITARGHRPVPVALPGQGDGDVSATFDDQRAAVLAAVDAASGPCLVVGHSAACTLAWVAADARPDAVAGTVLVGGFPTADGGTYADFFEPVDGVVPFPGWEPFEGPDSADLDDAARAAFVERSVAVPAGVTRGVVHLSDPRRAGVPVTVVCPEFSPDDARAWVASGDVPELAGATDVTYVDLATGHWPMVTAPDAFAAVLADAADRAAARRSV